MRWPHVPTDTDMHCGWRDTSNRVQLDCGCGAIAKTFVHTSVNVRSNQGLFCSKQSFKCNAANGGSEYPSWSSAVLNPLSICFDQGVGELNEFPHDCSESDLLRFSLFDHALVFFAHIGVVFDSDESRHVGRVAQLLSATLNACFATPLS